MPTYQYACTACDHEFDAFQSFADSALTECPECAGKLRKVYGSVGVVFKGSGFYRTDSRKEHKTSESSGEKSPSADKSDSAGSSATKGDSASSLATKGDSASSSAAKSDSARSSSPRTRGSKTPATTGAAS